MDKFWRGFRRFFRREPPFMCTTQLLFSSLDGATISRSCGRKIAKSKKKIGAKVCAHQSLTLRTDSWEFSKNSTAVLYSQERKCAPILKKIFSRHPYIALAIVKVRIWSPKTARNKCVRTKSLTENKSFQNICVAFMHVRDCSCASILRFFLCVVRWRNSRASNSDTHFFVNFVAV